VSVDGRSDVYSLGVLLYQALAGELPPSNPTPDQLRSRNPRVSVGLADILRRCLKPEPRDRYRDAASLAADLRRHLKDQPLRGVPNRSLVERWQKWRRRQPGELARATGMLLVTVALVLGLFFVWGRINSKYGAAKQALALGGDFMTHKHYGAAAETFKGGLEELQNVWGATALKRALQRREQEARRGEKAVELHEFVQKLRRHKPAELRELVQHLLLPIRVSILTSAVRQAGGLPTLWQVGWSAEMGLKVRDREAFVLAHACDNAWKDCRLLTDRTVPALERKMEDDIRADLITLLERWPRVPGVCPEGAGSERLAELESLLGPLPPLKGAPREDNP
jgi:hypothetical protein